MSVYSYEALYRQFVPDLAGSGPELRGTCPVTRHAKSARDFCVDTATGLWKCHNCGMQGNAREFLRALNHSDAEIRRLLAELEKGTASGRSSKPRKAAAKTGSLPESQIDQLHDALVTCSEGLDRLAHRGITLETINWFKLGREQDRFCIPIRNESGEAVNIKKHLWRKPKDKEPKTYGLKNRNQPRLFGIDRLGDASPNETVYLCEGEFDAIRLAQEGYLALCSTGGAETWPNPSHELFHGHGVVIVYDSDSAGRKGAAKLVDWFGQDLLDGKIPFLKNIVLPFTEEQVESGLNDLTDWLRQHSIEDFDNLVADTRAVNPGEIHRAELQKYPEPEALGEQLPPVEPFVYSLLPETFRPWLEDVCERMQAPPDFSAATLMVALGSLIGRKVAIRPKQHDDWTVIPNLFGMIIGRPSVMKSPLLSEIIRPLERLEMRAKERYEEEEKRYLFECDIRDIKQESRKQTIKKKLKQGIEPQYEDYAAEEADAPVRRRYLINDATVEKLGEILRDNPNGVLIKRDELVGFLRNLDKEGRESDRAFYLEAWDGKQRFTYDRIGRGTVEIESAIVSVIGSIQPGMIEAYVRNAVDGGLGDDGLMQRFQFAVWPDVSKTWRNVDRRPDTQVRDAAYTIYEYLDDLDPDAVGAEVDDKNEFPFLRFSPEAQTIFNQWRLGLEQRLRAGNEATAVESHLAKYRSLVPSIALVLHLAEKHSGPVDQDDIERAIRWAAFLESHARRIYACALDPLGKARLLARKILEKKVQDGFSLRDVYRNHWAGLASKDEVLEAADGLIELD